MRRKELLMIFAVLMLPMFLVAAEAPGIAVVNLERVFNEFYKSRIAEDAIKEQAEVYRSYMLRQNDELRKLTEEARTARSDALNLALSEEEQKQAGEKADRLETAVREKRAEIELYARGRSDDMRRLESKKRAEIMEEILVEVRRRAAAEGFSYVFDSSGQTMNMQPSVLVFPDSADITDGVITELNRSAIAPREQDKVATPANSSGE